MTRARASTSTSHPKGHALRYDAADRLVGITIVNATRLLDRDGRVIVTTDEPISVDRAALAAAIGAA